MAYIFTAGAEFPIPESATGPQDTPAITPLVIGSDYIVTWHDESGAFGDGSAVVAQVFDKNGVKVAEPFRVNTATAGVQGNAEVTGLNFGLIAVTWEDGDGRIKGQVFTSHGEKQGPEFTVDSLNTNGNPTITALSGTNFVIAWAVADAAQGDADGGVRAQIFQPYGAKVGSSFLINSGTTGLQDDVTIEALDSGGFVAAWTDHNSGSDGSGSSIRAQVFTATGAKAGAEVVVNTQATGDQLAPAITKLSDGRFVITWQDTSGDAGGGLGGSGIKGQVFTAGGAKVGTEFLVNTETTGDQHQADVAALSNGGFVVTWTDASGAGGDSSGSGIKAQLFDTAGAKVGTEFLVNQITTGDQVTPVVTVLDDGSFVVAWESNDAIHSRLYKAIASPGDVDGYYIGTDASEVINGGDGNDTIIGLVGNDVLRGDNGNDFIDGGVGYDSLYGGEGNDTLISGGGNGFGFGERLEGGNGDDSLTGSVMGDTLLGGDGADTLTGGSGIFGDILDGGAGADWLYGGDAHDTYVIDDIGDQIVDTGTSVLNSVRSSIDFVAPDKVLDLILIGSGNVSGTGNGWDNRLTGNGGNNVLSGLEGKDTLSGGAGNDTLDGGAGDDVLEGGTGNDTYYLEVGDALYEKSGEGFDTVYTALSLTLKASIERVIFTGSGNYHFNGSVEGNEVYGTGGNDTFLGVGGNDTLSGFGGHDKLDGGEGNDTLLGGDDNDSLLGANGIDSLDGGAGNDQLNGGGGADLLLGGAGNDILDGGLGADALSGGAGDDVYVVDDAGDVVTEGASAGKDSVKTALDYALTGNVEVLNQTGTGNISGTGNGEDNTLNGNIGNNLLAGGLGNDNLYGGGGDDTLSGGAGADWLVGGAGADDYVYLAPADNGYDMINGFEHGIDRLVFKGSDYGFAAGHALTAAQFTVGSAAVGASAQFVWDSVGRHLYFDADGDGAGAAIELALISGATSVTKEDLYFTA